MLMKLMPRYFITIHNVLIYIETPVKALKLMTLLSVQPPCFICLQINFFFVTSVTNVLLTCTHKLTQQNNTQF